METIQMEEFPDLIKGGWKIKFPMPAFKKDRQHYIITRSEDLLRRYMTLLRIVLALEITGKQFGALRQLNEEIYGLEKKFTI